MKRRGAEFLLAGTSIQEAVLFCQFCGGRLDGSPHEVDCSGVVCSCVRARADDPTSPLKPNRLGEFERAVGSQQWVVYFCFWCGTRLPEGRRGDVFTAPTNEDLARLRGWLDGARTVEDVFDRLGPPDCEFDPLSLEIEPEHAPERRVVRRLNYQRLCPTADLVVQVLRDNSVRILFSGKYIGFPPDCP